MNKKSLEFRVRSRRSRLFFYLLWIKIISKLKGSSRKSEKQVNPEAKLLVEQNAVNTVRAYYQKLGFDVASVEKDNCGWDLTATHPNGTKRLIEVKGLSGQQISVQITPNEYKALKKRHKNYILAVYTNAIVSPVLHIFMIHKQADGVFKAYDDDGNILEFVESVSAVAQLIPKKNSDS